MAQREAADQCAPTDFQLVRPGDPIAPPAMSELGPSCELSKRGGKDDRRLERWASSGWRPFGHGHDQRTRK
jgi:hypothetical protein